MTTTAIPQWASLPEHQDEIQRVRQEFRQTYGKEPDGVWSAPGRFAETGCCAHPLCRCPETNAQL